MSFQLGPSRPKPPPLKYTGSARDLNYLHAVTRALAGHPAREGMTERIQTAGWFVPDDDEDLPATARGILMAAACWLDIRPLGHGDDNYLYFQRDDTGDTLRFPTANRHFSEAMLASHFSMRDWDRTMVVFGAADVACSEVPGVLGTVSQGRYQPEMLARTGAWMEENGSIAVVVSSGVFRFVQRVWSRGDSPMIGSRIGTPQAGMGPLSPPHVPSPAEIDSAGSGSFARCRRGSSWAAGGRARTCSALPSLPEPSPCSPRTQRGYTSGVQPIRGSQGSFASSRNRQAGWCPRAMRPLRSCSATLAERTLSL